MDAVELIKIYKRLYCAVWCCPEDEVDLTEYGISDTIDEINRLNALELSLKHKKSGRRQRITDHQDHTMMNILAVVVFFLVIYFAFIYK